MHELGIVQNLIERAAEAANGRPLQRIHVTLGQLAGVSQESLAFYYNLARPDTPAAQAELVVRTEPGRIQCRDCQRESTTETEIGQCPACGSTRLLVIRGDRLILAAIDVED